MKNALSNLHKKTPIRDPYYILIPWAFFGPWTKLEAHFLEEEAEGKDEEEAEGAEEAEEEEEAQEEASDEEEEDKKQKNKNFPFGGFGGSSTILKNQFSLSWKCPFLSL